MTRIVFIQHGDYAETVDDFARGGSEQCGRQRFSVDAVAGLVPDADEVVVVCITAGPYDRVLSNGVRGVGVPLKGDDPVPFECLLDALGGMDVTHLIPRMPTPRIIRWGIARKLRVLPMLADSFRPSIRRWVSHRRIAQTLNDPRIDIVGNHNVNASRTLARIGVAPDKIVPWDWPLEVSPADRPAKSAPAEPHTWRLIYVGAHAEAKGVGEVIAAVGALRGRGRDVELTCVGGGEVERFAEQARRLGVDGHVRFSGRIAHERILPMMAEHDIVVVPSRREYPEGMPKTLDEAFCSRSPLVASDHPVFAGKAEHGVTAMVFRSADAEDLSVQIDRLMGDPDLYARLSEGGAAGFARLRLQTRWDEVIRRWVRNDEGDRRWLRERTLATMEAARATG